MYILRALNFRPRVSALREPFCRCGVMVLHHVRFGAGGLMPVHRYVVGACVEGTDAEGGRCEGRTARRFVGAGLVFYGVLCVAGVWAFPRNGGGW